MFVSSHCVLGSKSLGDILAFGAWSLRSTVRAGSLSLGWIQENRPNWSSRPGPHPHQSSAVVRGWSSDPEPSRFDPRQKQERSGI
jgi:hypothetical protein